MKNLSSSIVVCSQLDRTEKIKDLLSQASIPYIHSPQDLSQITKTLREDHESLLVLFWESESNVYLSEVMEQLESLDILVTRPVLIVSEEDDLPPSGWLSEYQQAYHMIWNANLDGSFEAYVQQVSSELSENQQTLKKFRLAVQCVKAEDYSGALDQILALPIQQNTRLSVHYALALIQYLSGRYDKALEALESLPDEDHSQVTIVDLFARCFLAEKDFSTAIKFFEKAMHLNPMHLGRKCNLAHACLLSGQYERAAELYQQLIEEKPSCEKSLFGLIKAAFFKGAVDEATKLISNLRDSESKASVINVTAVMGIKKGLVQDSLRLFAASADILPNDWGMLSKFGFNMGVAYYRNRDFENAARCFGISVVLDPENDKARENLALLQDYLDSDDLPSEPEEAVHALSHFGRTA